MNIVPMNSSHIKRAAQIERLCFPDPWPEAFFVSELNNPGCIYLAALEGDELLAYAGLQYVLDEGYINNIAVAPGYRRLGIASRLLSALEQRAEELELAFMTLEVRSGNSPAIALYESLGFKPVGLRKNYYERPKEDALLMTKYLSDEGQLSST
jgi:ribosomal-protein-alanine N-acetyltransferase